MRIVFFGTPDIAATCLQELIDNSIEVVACYTRTDKPQGRGRKILKSPVKTLAEKIKLPVIQPKTLKSTEVQEELKSLKPDLCVVVAFGMIFPKEVLKIPKYGCLNVHASLLPKYRGAAPINTSILKGETKTGITIMQMDPGLDTGDMLLQESCEITELDTTLSLTTKLAKIGAPALIKVIQNLQLYQKNATPQDNNLATIAPKIDKNSAKINWLHSARDIQRQINAYNPWPIAQSLINGQNIKIYKAAINNTYSSEKKPGAIILSSNKELIVSCGNNEALSILELQFPGKKVLPTKEILNSKKDFFQKNNFETK